MPKLINKSVSELYTVSADSWTAINQRVGTAHIYASGKIPATDEQNHSWLKVINQTYNLYPELTQICKKWMDSTFDEIIARSKDLANYANIAVADFGGLNQQVKKIDANDSDLTDNIKDNTAHLLQKFFEQTDSLAKDFLKLSTEIKEFLDVNTAADAKMAANSRYRIISPYILFGSNINKFETAADGITGEWNAIRDDLSAARVLAIDVNLAFIESLELDAAIVSWQTIHDETSSFFSMASNQKKYWENPFQT